MSYAHVVHTTAKQVISRRRKNENVRAKCQTMKNARAKRAKILSFIVKYANLWSFCYRRRCGCLSSLVTVQNLGSPGLSERVESPAYIEYIYTNNSGMTGKNCSCRWGIVNKFSLSRKIWRASFSLTRKNCQVRNLLV